MTSEVEVETLLTSADMAKIYRCASADAFMKRFERDRKLPRELRNIPDPINRVTKKGIPLLWSRKVVAASQTAKYVWVRE